MYNILDKTHLGGIIVKYIRTKNGRIIDLNSKLISSYQIIDDKTAIEEYGLDSGFICVYYFDWNIGEHLEYDVKGGRSMDNWDLKDIVKQADTIKELICDDDILYIHDLYPDAVLVVEGNIKPFGYQTAIKLKEWLKYTHIKFDLFIKDSEGNYIKRATTNAEGELELL